LFGSSRVQDAGARDAALRSDLLIGSHLRDFHGTLTRRLTGTRPPCKSAYIFTLDSVLDIASGQGRGNDRAVLKRLLRYSTRPPFALERLG